MLWLMDGFNAAVITLGQAGTGKSVALFGAGQQPEQPLLLSMLRDLFQHVISSADYRVGVSAWELHNGGATGLLASEHPARAEQESTTGDAGSALTLAALSCQGCRRPASSGRYPEHAAAPQLTSSSMSCTACSRVYNSARLRGGRLPVRRAGRAAAGAAQQPQLGDQRRRQPAPGGHARSLLLPAAALQQVSPDGTQTT